MNDRDPKELADRLEREADELERRSGEVEGRVKAMGEDWERKRADPGVPGAPPPEGREDKDGGEQTSSSPPADTGD